IRSGAMTTCQDGDRPGWAHLAVPPSGAADRHSWRLANQLAGNATAACALETTLTGCTVRAHRDVTVVVGGAPCAVTVAGRPEAWGQPVKLTAVSVLDAGPAEVGVRSYLAFSGGLHPKASLGSHSTCLLSGLGPAPLKDGDTIPLGPSPAHPPLPTQWPAPWAGVSEERVMKLHLGPRLDRFTADAVNELAKGVWTESESSNRVGLRLVGPPLRHANPEAEQPSEGIVAGSRQVPADGQPILFGADHPTTGSYPVIGVVGAGALAAAAQARPGTRIRFVPLPMPQWNEMT